MRLLHPLTNTWKHIAAHSVVVLIMIVGWEHVRANMDRTWPNPIWNVPSLTGTQSPVCSIFSSKHVLKATSLETNPRKTWEDPSKLHIVSNFFQFFFAMPGHAEWNPVFDLGIDRKLDDSLVFKLDWKWLPQVLQCIAWPMCYNYMFAEVHVKWMQWFYSWTCKHWLHGNANLADTLGPWAVHAHIHTHTLFDILWPLREAFVCLLKVLKTPATVVCSLGSKCASVSVRD